jgi:hypothetical protein
MDEGCTPLASYCITMDSHNVITRLAARSRDWLSFSSRIHGRQTFGSSASGDIAAADVFNSKCRYAQSPPEPWGKPLLSTWAVIAVKLAQPTNNSNKDSGCDTESKSDQENKHDH